MTYTVRQPSRTAAFLPDCWLFAGYVLPMYSEVDRINLGVHRQYSRGTQGERRRYVWASRGLSRAERRLQSRGVTRSRRRISL